MKAKPVIQLVWTECKPEDEEKFNAWYNETHVPLIMKTGEVEEVTRYKIMTDDNKHARYLAIYKCKDREAYARWRASPQMLVVRAEKEETWGQDSFELKGIVQYEAFKTWKKKP